MMGISRLDADFRQFLYLDQRVAVAVTYWGPGQARLDLSRDSMLISRCVVHFGPRPTDQPMLSLRPAYLTHYPAGNKEPQATTWDQLPDLAGDVAYATEPEQAAARYPRLSAAIGAQRLAAILALTRLVGMVSPGKHSTFHRLAVTLVDEPVGEQMLRFETTKTERRFQLATLAIRAPGLAGVVIASRRKPPVSQPNCSELQPLVKHAEFRGHTALVVGGSRGLGELTAKLLALSGVRTLVTYAVGRADAEAVVKDIRAYGKSALTLPLDVLAPLPAQLDALPSKPTSMYFFATPGISMHPSSTYSTDRYQRFSRFYVDAFYGLCTILADTCGPLEVLYPSSSFVTEPTMGMLEYAMAKAAGEVLAADLTRFYPNLRVEVARLPRLPTDQTSGLIDHDMGSAIDWLYPLVDKIESRVAERQG